MYGKRKKNWLLSNTVAPSRARNYDRRYERDVDREKVAEELKSAAEMYRDYTHTR